MIVGTAGHIDHGKTALVKALTGIDADRLAEEKRRGITIDLGFAHMELPMPNGEMLRIGFVDVPGHERFVRNMLAGVGGIDLVLLVIAADESIKPQTREHFDILQLLGVNRGITVLTKADAVDAETLDVVRMEVEDFVRGTFLQAPKSPIIAVSSLRGTGIAELKQALVQAAMEAQPRDSRALARLPIDRVFTIKGFGTVVTGTLISGTIRREEEMQVFPIGNRVRVRGLQVHGQAAESASAGQRLALNLAGASKEDLARGMSLAHPATFETTRRVDVNLRLLPSAPRALKLRTSVHFHSGTMEALADIRLHGGTTLRPGQEAFAQIKFRGAHLLSPGDRFIIRQSSPVITIGGGVVLDASPISLKPSASDLLKFSKTDEPESILLTRIARRRYRGLTIRQVVAETGWRREGIESLLKSPVAKGAVLRVDDLLLDAAVQRELETALHLSIAEFHQQNPLVPGVSRETLREKHALSEEVFAAVIGALLRQKKVQVDGDQIRLTGRGVLLKDDEAESKAKIETAFATAGLKVPSLHEVLAGLRVDKIRAQKIVTLLLRDRTLVKLSDELVFHRGALEELVRLVKNRRSVSPKVDVATFKDWTGVSRKYAIPLLEYLDRERVTKRVGDAREIL